MDALDKEEVKCKRRKRTVFGLVIMLILVLVGGVSYALWQLTFTQTGTNVITTGCLQLTLTEDTDAINITDATPTSDTDGKRLDPFTFTLENVCTTETAYVVNLETVSSGDKILADNYVKANLVSGENELFLDNLKETHINEEKVIEEATTAYKLHQGKLGNKEKISFSLRLWMDEATPADDAVMEALWQGKITVTATYVPAKNMNELYNIVESQAVLDNVSSEFVTASTGIDFGVAPSDTNGKGVYTIADTKDDEYPVHYFRGAVNNNNVKFANFCWKIVRTTETGGVKLIYNGVPNEAGGCTNTTGEATQIGTSAFFESDDGYINEDQIGYMYPESTNENSTIIKTKVDTWYQNNMTDYTNMLEDTIWCNDRSVYAKEGSNTYYGAYGRNTLSSKPSVVCLNDNDKFTVNTKNGNGKLTYPVALLTADEVTLAGNGEKGYSTSSYLYTGEYWWTLSPIYFDYTSGFEVAGGFVVESYLYDYFLYRTASVRPSISLLSGTTIDSGDGSENSPYEIIKKP